MNTLKFGNGEWYGKKDTILAYNDLNSNFKPLPFSFDRASSATVINKDGLIETVGSGEPRVDYKDDSKGALLLEPTRSNSFLQSNQFDTTWTLFNAVRTPNQIGVGNSTDAWKITDNTTNSRHSIIQNTNTGGIISLSIYAKANSVNFIYLRGVTNSTNKYTWFNLANGTVGVNQGISAEIVPMGNGWYRCTMTLDHQYGFENYIGISNEDGVSTYQGDGFGSAFIQYSQSEIGSYATSYIPTSGGAVTRVAESCSQTVPSGVIGQTEGTMYWEGKFQDAQNPILMQIVPSSANYLSSIYIDFNKSANSINFYIYDSGLLQATFNTSATTETKYKIALAYKQNDIQGYVNGVSIGSDTTATIQSGLNNLLIGGLVGYINNSSFIGTKPNEVKLYNTRLSNAELQALTT